MGKVEFRTEIDAALLKAAQDAGVGLSDATEAGLRLALEQASQTGSCIDLVAAGRRQRADPVAAERRARQWADENAEAIKTHNERIAARGMFGEDLRRW